MKLSEDQIQELYKFTTKRLVKHYDLQTELVDHLANGIEQQWEENCEIAFDEALQNEFKKFGHFGFKTIIKRRKKTLAKRYRRYIFKFYQDYFKLPKILIMLGFIVALFTFLQFIRPNFKIIVFSLIFCFIGVLFYYYAHQNRTGYRDRTVTRKKRWMLEEYIYKLGDGASMAIFPMYIFNFFLTSEYSLVNPYLELALCVFTICYLALSYVVVSIIPKKAEELLAETYPEYKLVN